MIVVLILVFINTIIEKLMKEPLDKVKQEFISAFYEKYIIRVIISDVMVLMEHYTKIMSIYLIESANL